MGDEWARGGLDGTWPMAYDRRPDVTTFVNEAMRDKASPLLLGAVLAGLGVLVLLAARIVTGDAPEARLGPRGRFRP